MVEIQLMLIKVKKAGDKIHTFIGHLVITEVAISVQCWCHLERPPNLPSVVYLSHCQQGPSGDEHHAHLRIWPQTLSEVL